jgi:hypothetical protein
MLNILFMGSPDFAKESLEAVYNTGYNILGVVTNPDKPKGRGMKMIPTPVKEFALEKGIEVYQPEKVRNNDEFINKIKDLNPDLICVVAYGKILPKEILDIPKFGCINVHGSLLPKYRGAAPIQWAVLNGDKTTGITEAKWSYSNSINSLSDFTKINETIEGTDIELEIPQEPIQVVGSARIGLASAYSVVYSLSHPTTIKYSLSEDEQNYIIDYDILCYLEYSTYSNGGTSTRPPMVGGEYAKYEAKNVEITVYGNTIGIELENTTVEVGNGNKHPLSIGGSNELLQTNSNYIESNFAKTLNHYSNGKETATLLCSISDYYDEKGNKVISIDNSTGKMCFRMYDIVEPYVCGANGQDKPLSRNKNGNPKQFQVLGVKPIYDGAVWQELTLQEV